MGISDWSSDVCSSDLAIHFNGWYTARFELDGSGAERLWLTRDAIERLSIPFGFPFEALGNAVVWADVLQPLHAQVGDAPRKARGCARHVNRGTPARARNFGLPVVRAKDDVTGVRSSGPAVCVRSAEPT